MNFVKKLLLLALCAIVAPIQLQAIEFTDLDIAECNACEVIADHVASIKPLQDYLALFPESEQIAVITQMLMYAIECGNVQAVQYLLAQGADVNAVVVGKTPLMQAVMYQGNVNDATRRAQATIIGLLLDYGADLLQDAQELIEQLIIVHGSPETSAYTCQLWELLAERRGIVKQAEYCSDADIG